MDGYWDEPRGHPRPEPAHRYGRRVHRPGSSRGSRGARQPSDYAVRSMEGKVRSRLEFLRANEREREAERTEEERHEDAIAADIDNWGQETDYHKLQEEERCIFISSATRDPYRFPNAGQFEVDIQGEITNIVKAELVQASIPLVDPSVHSQNNKIRFSFAPHSTVTEIQIPEGSYLGADLAVEITRQMNHALFTAQVTADTYVIDAATGLAFSSGAPPVGVSQFYVQFNKSRQQMIFQYVDEDLLPDNSATFALHWKPRPPKPRQLPYRELADDLCEVLGFNRINFQAEAAALTQYHAATDTYYLAPTPLSRFNGFGGTVTNAVDQRYRYGVASDQAVDLRGSVAMILDIDPLNDNTAIRMEDSAGTGALTVDNIFGFLLLRDPASVTDRILELSTNTPPVRQVYREGRGRVRKLGVTLRRPDGTIFEMGNLNFFLTVRLVVSVHQPKDAPRLVR